MRSHIGLLPQCLFIVRSRGKVNRLEESYVICQVKSELVQISAYWLDATADPTATSRRDYQTPSIEGARSVSFFVGP
jgi:hypothetical protein